jgi:ABC-2 type transport system permease protein
VRLYWEVTRTTARRMATYRGATFAGIVTNSVFGFIQAYVLLAVWEAKPSIGGFDAVDAVTFTFVVQGLLMTVGMFGGDQEMSERIHSGEVAVDLCRPYDYQAWWAGVAYGKASFYAWARGIPPFVVGALVFDMRLPPEPWMWPAFVVGVVLAVGVGFGWQFLLQTCAFWLVDVRGLNQLGWITALTLSGTVVPLVLFPAGVESVLRALPFASMMQLPVEVFLGKHTGLDLVAVYLVQAAWLVALGLAGRLLLARAERKVVVHGG